MAPKRLLRIAPIIGATVRLQPEKSRGARAAFIATRSPNFFKRNINKYGSKF